MENGILTVRSSLLGAIVALVLCAGLLALTVAVYGEVVVSGFYGELWLVAIPAIACLGFWLHSTRRIYRFDLKRGTYEETVCLLPILWRIAHETADIACAYADETGLWIVRRAKPKRSVKLTQFIPIVSTAAACQREAYFASLIAVPFGVSLLADFPERNPRYARYDSERIVFRKHPLQRFAAAVFSKAFALASLIASGLVTIVVARHISLSSHLSLTTNIQSVLLSAAALIFLYAAGPDDVAFNLQSGTYTLSTGLLYFARNRSGSIEEDLSHVATVNQGDSNSSSKGASTAILLYWKRGGYTTVGSFANHDEALAHAERLALYLAAACGAAPDRFLPDWRRKAAEYNPEP